MQTLKKLGDLIDFKTQNSVIEMLGHVYHVDAMQPNNVVYHVLTPSGACFKVHEYEIIVKEIKDGKTNSESKKEDTSKPIRIAGTEEIPDAGQESRSECESKSDTDGEKGEIIIESKSENRRKSKQSIK